MQIDFKLNNLTDFEIKYVIKKTAPPCCPIMYGKRQILPKPTAEPIAAKINEYLENGLPKGEKAYLNSKNVTNEKSLELLEFIKEYDKVVRIMSYVDYSYQNVDTETAKNAVLKNITK